MTPNQNLKKIKICIEFLSQGRGGGFVWIPRKKCLKCAPSIFLFTIYPFILQSYALLFPYPCYDPEGT